MRITNITKEDAVNEYCLYYTGELVTIDYGKGESRTYRVIKCHFTPSGMLRDCGDHWILAMYSCYTRIDKTNHEIRYDVVDR